MSGENTLFGEVYVCSIVYSTPLSIPGRSDSCVNADYTHPSTLLAGQFPQHVGQLLGLLLRKSSNEMSLLVSIGALHLVMQRCSLRCKTNKDFSAIARSWSAVNQRFDDHPIDDFGQARRIDQNCVCKLAH